MASVDGKEGKGRDAERSRGSILAAAEALFAARGFDGVSLGEIAAAAGLSRGAPSYFFNSKEQLYRAVLERAFADREEVAREACRPLIEWAKQRAAGGIRRPLALAVEGYIEFLLNRPDFVRLIQREELAGARRLSAAPRESAAISEAFRAVRAVAHERGLGAFDVRDAVLVFIALTFFPAAQRSTLMASLGRDLDEEPVRRAQVGLAVEQLMRLISAPASPRQTDDRAT